MAAFSSIAGCWGPTFTAAATSNSATTSIAVVATSYIGTLEQNGNQPPRARFTCARDWGSMMARFDASRSADPDGQIARYVWEFGDGKSGEGKTVSHTYAQSGDYTVKLKVTDGTGETHASSLGISAAPEVGSGTGLKAEYFDGQTLEGKPRVRMARRIAFQRRGWDGRFLEGGPPSLRRNI